MGSEFIAILKKLIKEQGRETLLNAAKCKAFLADYARGEYKKESRLLLQALDAGVQKAIDTTENILICKKQQIRSLNEDYGLVEQVATDIVDMLALVLRGDKTKTVVSGTEAKSKQTGAASPSLAKPKAPPASAGNWRDIGSATEEKRLEWKHRAEQQEEDDKILSLTGDELNDILNTTDFTEEAGSEASMGIQENDDDSDELNLSTADLDMEIDLIDSNLENLEGKKN
jgi:hypothetical protein